ncbi:MAG: LptF/LptG family permease, partial [Deltaproteobacteria bacterium]|nr:LptF/LptG family permease [Deltaproteobacteria bacterium]
MTILQRYLLRQNLTYFLLIFGLSLGIYLLVDVFDRLEKFLNQGVPAGTIVWYFVLKLPLIVTQLLPIVFLLSILIQLGLMSRTRELIALESSALSMGSVIRFFLVWALIWTGIHLFFSQYLGYASDRESTRIWDSEVRNRQVENRTLFDVWFKENRHMIHLEEVTPSTRTGRGLTVFETAADYGDLRKIVSAEAFSAEKDSGPWHLEGVTVVDPLDFSTRTVQAEDLNLATDPATFLVVDPKTDPEGLSIWQLGRVIEELERSGSGVARLRTVWHMKLAYTFSTICLTLVGLALALSSRNVYLLFLLGMLSVFI